MSTQELQATAEAVQTLRDVITKIDSQIDGLNAERSRIIQGIEALTGAVYSDNGSRVSAETNEQDKKLKHKCEICGARFERPQGLGSHKFRVHRSRKSR